MDKNRILTQYQGIIQRVADLKQELVEEEHDKGQEYFDLTKTLQAVRDILESERSRFAHLI